MRTSRILSVIFVLSTLVFSFTAPDAHGVKTLSGSITTNTVLDTIGGRIYRVTGSVTVNAGVTLTVNPGVVLKFNAFTGLTINGTLTALGGATQDSLIYFTSVKDDNAPAPFGHDTNGDGNSTVPNNQDWATITFQASSSNTSTLKNCIIRFGGYSATGIVVCNDASPTLENCALFAAYYGLRCNGTSKPVVKNTKIDAMTDVPIAIEIAADPVLDNLVFKSTSNNGFDALGVLGGTLSGPNTLRIRGATLGVSPIPNLVYILLSTVTVAPGGTLTIQPGVVLKPKSGVGITVQGTLNINGTSDPDSQIVVTSFKDDTYGTPNDTNNDGSITSPSRGDWGIINFLAGSSGAVSRAVFRFGGNTSQGVIRTFNVSPAISNCSISNTYFGIEQAGTSSSSISNVSISNCLYTPIYMSVSANPTFSSLTFSNNGITALGLIGETIGVNSLIKVRNLAGFDNITYYLHSSLTMAQGAHLRIEPGIVLKMSVSGVTTFIINGSLKADGKSDSTIVFTSLRDDAAGNPLDTEGNGSATTPAAANWGHIKYSSTSTDALSKLNYCVLSYGGGDCCDVYRGAVWCNGSSPTITNCSFKTNWSGIRTDGTAAPLIQNNDFFNHTYIPLATSVVSVPTYVGNTFNQNAYHAVGVLSETLAQNAVLERIEVGGPPQYPAFFPYLHLGTLTIGPAASLTVQTGVVVKMLGGQIPFNVQGTLKMIGKPDADSIIVYTSIKDDSYGGDTNVDGSATSPSAGDWNGIQFQSTTNPVTKLEHCLLRFGGSSRLLDLQSASPTIRNCEFEINTWGMWIQNVSNPVVENNLFRLTTYLPVSISVIASPTFSGNAYDNNKFDALGLIGETIGQDLTITKRNLAGYTNISRILVGGPITVNLGATLTIDPGVVIKLGRAFFEPFGTALNINGAVRALGSQSEPVVFTSVADDSYGNPPDTNNDGSLTQPTAGNWAQIEFRDVSTDSVNVLQWCVVRYGGLSGYAVNVISASPAFKNCTLESNGTYGIRISGASNPVIQNCTFAKHTTTPVVMSLISNPAFSGNKFLASNGYKAIGILGETLAQDVLWKRRNVAQTQNIPYILTGNLTAGLSSILRIQPGVVIKPLSGVNITVKRGLIAEGKADPESLIVFTSPRDDFYGGDTNSDSTVTEGSSLRWGWVQIDDEAIDDSTRFNYCVFRFSTNSSTTGAVNITNAHPKIRRSIFTRNGVGINYNGAAGDSTKGKVENCDIFGNAFFGIRNTGMSFTVSAKNCWWGHATGPNDPSNDIASGGFYNPGGLGDKVTDKVDYSGWKTGGVQNYLLGDVSLNGDVRAFDASLVLQHLALLITLSPLQQKVGDVTCAGGLSTLDASYILRYVAGLISYFPCAFDSIPTAPPILAEHYPGLAPGKFKIHMPTFSLEPGGSATVRIEVSGDGEIMGHEYRIAFDPELLTIEDVRLTEAARDAMLAWNVVGGRELRIALASRDILPVESAVVIALRGTDELGSVERIAFDFTLARINEQDLTGEATSGGGRSMGGSLPASFALMQNHPNPFNPSTTVRYAIPGSVGNGVRVRLVIYDVSGREVRELVNRDERPGTYPVVWDGRDNRGESIASGVYLYKLQAGGFTSVKKMVLLK